MGDGSRHELQELQTLLRESLEQQQQADVSAALVFLPLCLALGWWTYDATGALLPFVMVAVGALWYVIQQVRLVRASKRGRAKTTSSPNRTEPSVVAVHKVAVHQATVPKVTVHAVGGSHARATLPAPAGTPRPEETSTDETAHEGDKAHARTNSIPRLQHRHPV